MKIDEVIITNVLAVKLLGVIIDFKLKFDDHVINFSKCQDSSVVRFLCIDLMVSGSNPHPGRLSL